MSFLPFPLHSQSLCVFSFSFPVSWNSLLSGLHVIKLHVFQDIAHMSLPWPWLSTHSVCSIYILNHLLLHVWIYFSGGQEEEGRCRMYISCTCQEQNCDSNMSFLPCQTFQRDFFFFFFPHSSLLLLWVNYISDKWVQKQAARQAKQEGVVEGDVQK